MSSAKIIDIGDPSEFDAEFDKVKDEDYLILIFTGAKWNLACQ